jgi:hypothetical protein
MTTNANTTNRVRGFDKPLRLAPSKRVGDTKFFDSRSVVAPKLPLITTSRFEGGKVVGGRTVKPIGKAKLLGNGRPVKDTSIQVRGTMKLVTLTSSRRAAMPPVAECRLSPAVELIATQAIGIEVRAS